jgi:hypothetical protein
MEAGSGGGWYLRLLSLICMKVCTIFYITVHNKSPYQPSIESAVHTRPPGLCPFRFCWVYYIRGVPADFFFSSQILNPEKSWAYSAIANPKMCKLRQSTTRKSGCRSIRAGIFKKSMVARHRGRIGFSYRPLRLHRLAEFIPWNQFRGPINI